MQYPNSSVLTELSILNLTGLLRILIATLQLHDSEKQRIQYERCIQDLKTDLDNKERQISASNQKMKDLLLAASRSSSTIKQLEEHVQR